MSGAKGAKQKRILTNEQVLQIEHMLQRDKTIVLTNDHLSELGITRLAFARRASLMKLDVRYGITFGQFNDETPGKCWIGFHCENCGNATMMQARKLRARTYKKLANHPLCGKCYISAVVKTDKWRERNSNAQKIAQRRPEVLAKHRKNTLAMWRDPTSAIRKSLSQPLSGIYCGLRYDSLSELAYILAVKEKNYEIQRYNGRGIVYECESRRRTYIPDFIVENCFIVEVKGRHRNFDPIVTELKRSALEAACKSNELQFVPLFVWDTTIPKKFKLKARQIHEQNR